MCRSQYSHKVAMHSALCQLVWLGLMARNRQHQGATIGSRPRSSQAQAGMCVQPVVSPFSELASPTLLNCQSLWQRRKQRSCSTLLIVAACAQALTQPVELHRSSLAATLWSWRYGVHLLTSRSLTSPGSFTLWNGQRCAQHRCSQQRALGRRPYIDGLADLCACAAQLSWTDLTLHCITAPLLSFSFLMPHAVISFSPLTVVSNVHTCACNYPMRCRMITINTLSLNWQQSTCADQVLSL